jgi:hypothetical protein
MARAKAAGVEDRVTLLQSDFMDTDVFAALCDLRSRLKNALDRPREDLLKIDGAPFVIAMYLLPDALYRLHPSIEWCVEISCSFLSLVGAFPLGIPGSIICHSSSRGRACESVVTLPSQLDPQWLPRRHRALAHRAASRPRSASRRRRRRRRRRQTGSPTATAAAERRQSRRLLDVLRRVLIPSIPTLPFLTVGSFGSVLLPLGLAPGGRNGTNANSGNKFLKHTACCCLRSGYEFLSVAGPSALCNGRAAGGGSLGS